MKKNRIRILTVGAIALGLLLAVVLLQNKILEKDWAGWNGQQKNEKADGADGSWKIFDAVAGADGVNVRIVGENYMRMDGSVVAVDSEESKTTTAKMLTDGICDDADLRWSSDNDWEDNEHWVQVSFAEALPVGCIRLYWERLNALQYAIEVSQDGKEWTPAVSFTDSPSSKCQDIVLETCVEAGYLRLHIFDVKKEEEDASLYYQNVSLLEMEVYGGFTDEFVIKTPAAGVGTDRALVTPQVPDGYQLEFAGCDYENVVDENGNIADTLSDVNVEIGYRLGKDDRWENLPAMELVVPGNVGIAGSSAGSEQDAAISGQDSVGLPKDFDVMEWLPLDGSYELAQDCIIYVEKDDDLLKSAEIFAEELAEVIKKTVTVVSLEDEGVLETAKGHICLRYSGSIDAKEGYRLSLGDTYEDVTVIEAGNLKGIRWGCVSFLKLASEQNVLPKGRIYDYPRYEVRGFGIDVGRRAIPIDMLYEMVEAMSLQKMNALLVHLNDNQIIAQSDHGGTIEGVRSLYSAFRLESDIVGKQGVTLTATDLFYTKEEFAKFVEWAALYGVEVVPEIDTPAHSLAIIKAFPDLGKTEDIYTADQLDLSQKETTELVKSIWSEYLEAEDSSEAVFAGCETVHIGMDEYFGDGEEFMAYISEIYSHIKEVSPDKKVRMWGSLTGKEYDYSEVARDIEIQLWSTDWADPAKMYEAGFDLVNSQKNYLYIIPGSGYDRLDVEYLENEWEVNVFETENHRWEIPVYSSQMKGACYMLWNDMIQIEGIEISEEDLYDRFYEPLDVIADKLWY